MFFVEIGHDVVSVFHEEYIVVEDQPIFVFAVGRVLRIFMSNTIGIVEIGRLRRNFYFKAVQHVTKLFDDLRNEHVQRLFLNYHGQKFPRLKFDLGEKKSCFVGRRKCLSLDDSKISIMINQGIYWKIEMKCHIRTGVDGEIEN